MTGSPRQQLADLLGDSRTGGSFSTRRTAPPGDLMIDVRGLGTIRLPVTAAQAKQLRLLARPARYGKGEETVLDRRVRDTWQVPRSRVRIDKRRWANTLVPMLDNMRDDLGLPATSSLKAELHSVLVYEPGQFFAAHQDSEKDDLMIGTLVVLLPSRTEGGELVVAHRGRSVTYPGSASSLTFVAFYADTRHEVRPVTRGHRVALTYNLMLAGSSTPGRSITPALTATMAAPLRQHFEQLPEPRWRGDREAGEPPDRLVFLLDHQYSERSLGWPHLKGEDAIRADALRRSAELADCATALALVEIQETWDCHESAPRRRRGWWSDDDSEDDFEDEDSDEDHELGELLDSAVTITSVGDKTQRFDPHVTDAELATSTPNSSLAPYDTEFTGYMGNWGNTMDRWYRRAAVVVWPRARSFAVRAKADALGATEELLAALADRRDYSQAQQEMAETLLRFWPEGVRRQGQRTLLPGALLLGVQLGDGDLAARLLDPFEIGAVTPTDAPALLAAHARYGPRWFDDRLTTWTRHRSRPDADAPSREVWTLTLPDLCSAIVRDGDPPDPTSGEIARLMVMHAWSWLDAAIGDSATMTQPSARRERMQELGPALLAVLRAAAVADDTALRQRIVDAVCHPVFRLGPLLLRAIDASKAIPTDELQRLGVVTLAQHCAESLAGELAMPERAAGDWSITSFVSGDGCQDCIELASFLADATRQQLVWPIAKPRRQHIHRCIDDAELPVTHRTTREGSPHKLVLTKTTDLFTQEAEQRTNARATLAAIQPLLPIGRPTRVRSR